jgi:hypothetical protein
MPYFEALENLEEAPAVEFVAEPLGRLDKVHGDDIKRLEKALEKYRERNRAAEEAAAKAIAELRERSGVAAPRAKTDAAERGAKLKVVG